MRNITDSGSDTVKATVSAASAVKEKVDELIAQHLPEIRKKLKTHVGDKILSLSDAEFEKAIFGVHKLLPFVVRVVLKKEKLLDFAKNNKEKLA